MIRRYRHITQRPDLFRLNTDCEIAQGLLAAYLAPTGLVGPADNPDSSLRSNHGTLSAITLTSWSFDSELRRSCLYLDGSGITSSTGNLQTAVEGLSALTISAWIRPASYGGSSQAYIRQVIGDDLSVSNGTFGLRLGVDGTEANKNKLYAQAMTTTRDYIAGSTVVPLNSWTHVLFRWVKGGQKTLWVNGVQDATGSADSGTISTSHYSPLKIGDDGERGRYWEGKLADILVYTTDMSAFVGQLADPSNFMYSGLILPPRRMVWPVAVAGGAYSLDCDSGSFTLAGQDVTLTTARILDAASGEFTLTGQDVGLNRGYTLSAESGSLTLTGQDVALTATRTIGADVGEFTLSGQDAALLAGRAVSADSGEFTLAGQDVTLTADRTLSAASGEFTLAGQDVTLTYTPVGEYSLTADSGSFTLAGQDVGLTADRTLSADTSEFTLSGQDVALQSGRVLGADVGEFALAGQDATLAAARTLSADSGTFTLTGQDVGLAHGYVLSAESGDYTLTGQDVTLSRTWALVVESAEYVLTGQAVTLTYSGVNQDGVLWTPAARSRVWTPAARSRVWTPSG